LDRSFASKHSYLIFSLFKIAAVQNHCYLLHEAEGHYEEAIALGGEANQKHNLTTLYKQLAFVKNDLGQFEEARILAQTAIRLAQTQGNPMDLVWVWHPLLETWMYTGEYHLILEQVGRLIAVSPSEALALLTEFRGHAQLALGDTNGALETFQELTGLLQKDTWNQHRLASSESALCAVYLKLGLLEQAAARARNAIALRAQKHSGFTPHWAWNAEAEAESLAWSGETPLLENDLRFRGPIIRPAKPLFVRVLQAQAVLSRAAEDDTNAIAQLRQALRIAEEIGMLPEQWQIQTELAHLLNVTGDSSAASHARVHARDVRDKLASRIPEPMREIFINSTDRQMDRSQQAMIETA
jgi:tetratricopeptide (TPR) repeat protein